ncbi:MAG TPA: hypothetical protein VI146_06780 [Nitrososphaeraceae archaeon]
MNGKIRTFIALSIIAVFISIGSELVREFNSVNGQEFVNPLQSTINPNITILDAKNFEITNALADTFKQAVPGIFVAKQCNQEMQSENFTHQELCLSILKQFNTMLAQFNNQTKANVTQLMAESRVQQ